MNAQGPFVSHAGVLLHAYRRPSIVYLWVRFAPHRLECGHFTPEVLVMAVIWGLSLGGGIQAWSSQRRDPISYFLAFSVIDFLLSGALAEDWYP